MKYKRHLVLVSIGGIIAIFAILYCQYRTLQTRSDGKDNRKANGEGPISTPAEEPHSLASDAEINRRKEALILSRYQTPIEIYGKVTNQDGAPISGAKVSISITDRPLQHSTYEKITDESGLFEVKGIHGGGFSLSASKDGYYSTKESTAYRDVLGLRKNDAPQTTKDRPISLILRKEGNPIPLLAAKTRQNEVPRTGQSVVLDLVTGQVDNGELQIASWISNAEQRPFDWKYQLIIRGGGLIARTGEFDFEAPADGYQQTAEIDMPANARKWSLRATKAYFARLPDGRYARFSIAFYPGQRRNFVIIQSYVNPSPGDRNLEFDPKKVVKPSSL